jgi:hypothetical protein
MEIISKEAFAKWAAKCNWLKVNDMSTPDGRQETYLTPSGGLRAIIYDLKQNVSQVASLGPADPQAPAPSITKGQIPFIGKG